MDNGLLQKAIISKIRHPICALGPVFRGDYVRSLAFVCAWHCLDLSTVREVVLWRGDSCVFRVFLKVFLCGNAGLAGPRA